MKTVDNDFRWKVCPACGETRARSLGALARGEGVSFGTTEVTLLHPRELWACAKCGTWFVQNSLRPDDATALYSVGMSGERWQAEPFDVAKPPEIVRVINHALHPGARVVDVGCNTGELLDYCQQLGAETFGVELSASSSAVCAAKGHTMLPSLEHAAGAMDVVLAFDLVEHLYDLPAFVDQAAAALCPGGRLLILTGNNGSITARTLRNSWWYVGYPEHVVFASHEYWSSLNAFRPVARIATYASAGYRARVRDRVKSGLRLSLGRGNGLPLVSGDHHLVVLEKR